jgi:hypothetical protein
MSLLRRIEQHPPSDFQDRSALRKWWHGILRDYEHRYSCSAMFLILPSDKETIRYLTDFGEELDIISGEDCLVIVLGKSEFRRSGFDNEVQRPSLTKRVTIKIDEIRKSAIREHVEKGYSVKIAQHFGVELTKFPCLLVFDDIRSPAHVIISLKGMTAEEIAERMRSVFTIIHDAAMKKANPLDELTRQQNSENFKKAGKTILSKVSGITEKTFETAMEAWINVVIK